MKARTRYPGEQRYALFDTRVGPCGVAWSEHGLTRLQLPESDRNATEKRLKRNSAGSRPEAAPLDVGQVIRQIQQYLAGERIDFSAVVIDLIGAKPFDRSVYESARAVLWGETASYGELARQIGSPGLARAVGQALSRNPIPIIVPCHRIVASGNRIGGFSVFGGIFAEEQLLSLEGVGAPRLPGI